MYILGRFLTTRACFMSCPPLPLESIIANVPRYNTDVNQPFVDEDAYALVDHEDAVPHLELLLVASHLQEIVEAIRFHLLNQAKVFACYCGCDCWGCVVFNW